MILLGSDHDSYLQYGNSRSSLYFTHLFVGGIYFLRYFLFFIYLFCFVYFTLSPSNCRNIERPSHSGHPSFFKSSGSDLWLASIRTPWLQPSSCTQLKYTIICMATSGTKRTKQTKDLPSICHILLSVLHSLGAVPFSCPQRYVQVSRVEGICSVLRWKQFSSFQLLWDFNRIALNPVWLHISPLTLIPVQVSGTGKL